MIIWPAAGFSAYWAHQILIETFLFGIAAASLIFLSAYGGMVSLAQTALFGIAGIILGNLATKGGAGRDLEGPPPRLGSDGRARRRDRRDDRDRADRRRGRLAEHRHLLPDDHPHLLGDRDLHARAGDEDLRLLGDRRHQPLHARAGSATSSRTRTGCTTSRSGRRSSSTSLIRYIVRTPFGVSAPGRPGRADPDELARLRRPAPPDARVRLRGVPRRARRGPLRLVERPGRARRRRPARRRSTC